jgi:hypothetical protein
MLNVYHLHHPSRNISGFLVSFIISSKLLKNQTSSVAFSLQAILHEPHGVTSHKTPFFFTAKVYKQRFRPPS